MKSPLYLTEKLPGGQLPPELWRWPVGLLSQKRKEKGSVSCFNGRNLLRSGKSLIGESAIFTISR